MNASPHQLGVQHSGEATDQLLAPMQRQADVEDVPSLKHLNELRIAVDKKAADSPTA